MIIALTNLCYFRSANPLELVHWRGEPRHILVKFTEHHTQRFKSLAFTTIDDWQIREIKFLKFPKKKNLAKLSSLEI